MQGCFEYITKNSEILTDNVPTKIYVNKIKNRATFKIKSGYCLEFLTPELWNYLETLKITDVVLFHCNIVNNDYQSAWFMGIV